MKTTLLACLCSIAISLGALAQTPAPPTGETAPPAVTPTVSISIAPTPLTSPSVSPTPAASEGDQDGAAARKKARHRLGVSVGGDLHKDIEFGDLDGKSATVAIVSVIFATLFGAPVLIVAVIMLFTYLKARSLHRTVRTMVEKGQPVPPELFAKPAPAVRSHPDVRRGIILSMVGIGLVIFFGAENGWRHGNWSIGMIPLLMGVGYLLAWKLTGTRDDPHVP